MERILFHWAALGPVAALCVLLAPAVNAQTTHGSIIGTARDSSGAVVLKVQVTVTNEVTGTQPSRRRTKSGRIRLPR